MLLPKHSGCTTVFYNNENHLNSKNEASYQLCQNLFICIFPRWQTGIYLKHPPLSFSPQFKESVRKLFSFLMGLHYELTECIHTFDGSVLLEVHVALDNHEHVVYPDTCATDSVKKTSLTGIDYVVWSGWFTVVLSNEMDLANSGLIRKLFIIGRGTKVLKKIGPFLILRAL